MNDLTSVITSLVEEGVFGKVKFVALKTDEDAAVGAQFMSSLTFVDLVVNGLSGEEVLPLVVKAQVEDFERQEYFDTCTMFQNELIMYQEVLPSLGTDCGWHPKLYYGSVTGARDILVFENLKNRGFTISRDKLFLDYDYISLAMKKIAAFHALSYVLKHEDNQLFNDLAKKLKPLSIPEDKELYRNDKNFISVERGIKAYEKRTADKEILSEFLSKVKNVFVVVRALTLPEEPFGVLCHGDFCNNNILYNYDDNSRPVDCAIFDFQLSQFGSPANDLAFFLYMHTTKETRDKYWDEFLEIYWRTLRENVPERIDIPSFQDFLKHFASRAVYGYLICSFFIPFLIENFKEGKQRETVSKRTKEEETERRKNMGGEEADEKIADVVSHLLHNRYINAFLEFVKKWNLAL